MTRVEADLDALLERDEALWQGLRGARLFITGGTGFVGRWLLESLLHANARLGLDARATVLSRDPDAFARASPRLHGGAGLEWIRGDVRDFTPPAGSFTHAIHAATEVVASADPAETFDVIVNGCVRMLDFCREREVDDLLLVSSGAVYGRQPPDLERMGEAFAGSRPEGAYGQGKRAAERLALEEAPGVRIARLFAFVGPYLPLDRHFAIGNFIGDRLAGRPIEVKGDGTAVRSYLYAADMARWLWAVLLKGRRGAAYNVGSEEGLSIGELAHRIAAGDNGAVPVRIAAAPVAGKLPERYVPSTRKAREALGLEPTVSLDDAITRTLAWARARQRT